MSDEYEATTVIREYDNPTEALADHATLRAVGIEALLVGDVANAAHPDWVAGRLDYGPIQLAVPASKREAALEALQEEDVTEEGWEETAEGAIDGWLCHNCDTVVQQDESICPACGSLRSEQPPEDDKG
jgi:hypothetical protein